MRELKLKGNALTPEVDFQLDGNLSIMGYSLPENAFEFYSPIVEWLQNYIVSGDNSINLTFHFIYFNTATAKMIVDILRILRKADEKKSVEVIWKYQSDDDEMKEVAMGFEEIVDMKFKLIEANS